MWQEKYIEAFIEACKGKKVFCFGASEAIRNSVENEKLFSGIEIKSYIANTGIDKEKGVYAPEILKEYTEDEIVVLIGSSSYAFDMSSQLDEMNIKNYFYYSWMKYDLSSCTLKQYDTQTIDKLKTIMADDYSATVIDAICRARTERNISYIKAVFSKELYFPEDLKWTFTKQEIFVDGGAYTGDTLERFLQKTNNSYSRIYAFEPDEDNFEILKKRYGDLDGIQVIKKAVSDKECSLRISGSSSSAKIFEFGEREIEAARIDNIIGKGCTFIKLDVEGHEMSALQGAENTIKKFKPKLAICLYHKDEDIYQIPFWIKKLVPEYKLFIRHQEEAIYGTVLYATVE